MIIFFGRPCKLEGCDADFDSYVGLCKPESSHLPNKEHPADGFM